MLYLTHSRVGRENLVLRHSVTYFPSNSGNIACWVSGGTERCPLPRHQSEETNINLNKYFNLFKFIFYFLENRDSTKIRGRVHAKEIEGGNF